MPARLGRYAVRRRIGAGAFATVWLAYDEQLDSPVAVKVLAENWSEDLAVRQRFLEEGRFLRKVESPHVVTVYDAGELDDGRPYLVMSYADQGTLADRLEIDGLTPAQALEVVREIGAGLQTLHERGVLHRDLKPANVLFRSIDGRVRAMVADLGLGKSMEVSSRLTVIAGTPSFVAPEQAQGEPLDRRADLYSLAALTYLMLASRAAFSHASLSAAAAPGPPPPLSTPERPFPPEVESVVARGLAADREQRWPDAASYVGALESALGPLAGDIGEPWLPLDPHLTQLGAPPSIKVDDTPLPEPTPPRRVRRWLLGTVAAVVVLAASGVGGYVVAHRGDPEVTVTDDESSISVTVPRAWDRHVATDGWRPEGADGDLPAVSLGTAGGWTDPQSGAQGVFAGILPGDELPAQLPQHPECGQAGSRVPDNGQLGPSATVVYSDCPGGVTVERVIQVTEDQLLWVQVRSHDRGTANRVLDDVAVHGM
ncbi:serine/threonine-protein kinase [Nocardioides conyzicola]|uniref:non-specific serine/threonine protein kinase n=1 Tax=Nocardioides conyzicola TaxID=1651781 RepID=A0ABP8XEW0_9ACTN